MWYYKITLSSSGLYPNSFNCASVHPQRFRSIAL